MVTFINGELEIFLVKLKYKERAEILSKAIKMMSNDNVNPDEYIERIIHKELDVDLYEVTTSNSPHDWIM